MTIDYCKQYDDFTIEELLALYETFGDRVLLHNGHIVGFEKEGEERLWK